MVEEVPAVTAATASDAPGPSLRLKETTVVTPHVEHSTSRQSVAAYEEEYQSSLSEPSRQNSSASNAGLLDTAQRYSTPPSSPPLGTGTQRQASPLAETATVSPPTDSRMSQGSRAAQEVRFDERQIRRKPVQNGSSSSSSGSPPRTRYPPPRTSLNQSPPDPDADDTPYIRFALDQITRDEEVRGSRRYPTQDRWSTAPPYSEAAYPIHQDRSIVTDPTSYSVPRPYAAPRSVAPRPGQAIGSYSAADAPYYDPLGQSSRSNQPSDPRAVEQLTIHNQPTRQISGESRYHTPPQDAAAAATYRITPVQSRVDQQRDPRSQPDVFVPYDSEVPSLRFLPGILRPTWLSLYIFLCLLMLAGMAFSGIWSSTHDGLFAYTTFGGARYFIFQYLPLLCGMFLLLWLFQIQIAVQRIAPFIAMASYNALSRAEGPLMEQVPTTFLLPKVFYFRAGQPIIGACMLIFWLQIFTIPLLACVYNVAYYGPNSGGQWTWNAVQGIVWTLFALYFLLVVALIVLGVWLWRQRTGLKWDPRSIADLIALLDRSNVTRDYEGSETFASAKDFRSRLHMRSDRLGYWTTSRKPDEIFYGIGEEGGATRRYSLEYGRIREKGPAEGVSGLYPDTPTTYGGHVDLEDGDEFDQVRYRYIPWYLSTSLVLLWIVAAILFYLAFLIVSFVNDAILRGFSPLLPVRATPQGFSSTNFLYSFIPALIAQILFLCWLSMDYAFRRLQPYAAMSDYSNSGAPASNSLLLDYPFRLPFSITVAALVSKDLRVAWFSFLSLIMACVPILAGGCFWAQWYLPTQEVRVAVNPSAYYALCVFLALFAFSLPLVLVGLRQRHLPHSCTTLAEQTSFLYGSQILGEREWRAPLGSKTEMTTRLMSAVTAQERATDAGRFIFGRFVGKDGRTHLGIERIGRDGSKRGRRTRDTSEMLTQPAPAARPEPRFHRNQAGRAVGTGSRLGEGDSFPRLPLAGATVVGAGAAGAGAYVYNYGSKQDLITESQKADYVRRKEGGTFGSPTSADLAAGSAQTTAGRSATREVPSAASRPVEPVSPLDDRQQIRMVPAATAYDYGSKQDLLSESEKADYIRRKEGGSFGSRPSSSAYPSGTSPTAQAPVVSAPATDTTLLTVAGATNSNVPPTTPYPSGSSIYPTPPTTFASHVRTASSPVIPPSSDPAAAARGVSATTTEEAPAPPTYPYSTTQGSLRDLTASEQAEHVRQRDGGLIMHGRSASGRSVPDQDQRSDSSIEEVDTGPDLPSMLREAAAGRWGLE